MLSMKWHFYFSIFSGVAPRAVQQRGQTSMAILVTTDTFAQSQTHVKMANVQEILLNAITIANTAMAKTAV